MAGEKTYEMLWDCQFCGTAKNLGKTHQFCPNCGAPQNADARYFPPDDEKVAVEDHQYTGADKICPACSTLNSARAIHCGNCGSPLDAAENVRTVHSGDWVDKNTVADKYKESRDVDQEKFERQMAAAGVKTAAAQAVEKEKKGRPKWLPAVLIISVLICGGLIWLFSQTRETTVVVSGHEWEREIRVEEYQAVREGAWRENVPISAYGERCTQKQRDTRQVPDGEVCHTERRDNGDGTFSERQVCETKYRSEPIYDTWCDYTIDKWQYERSVTTEGVGINPQPYWGDVTLQCGGNRTSKGCEREAGRNETYNVIYTGDGETYTCDFPLNEWRNIPIESTWTVEVGLVGGGARCGTLAPNR